MKSFKFFIIIVILAFVFLSITSCSPVGGTDQIRAENDGLNNAILMTAYKFYYNKQYDKGYELLSNYVFHKYGKSLLIHALLMKTAHKMNKIDELMKSYQKLTHNKFYMFAQSLLLILEERRKKDNLKLFRKLQYFFPQNPVVQMYLGYLYVLNNRPHLAVKILEKSLSSLKNFAFNNYFMGIAYYHIRDKNEASNYVKKAIELFPSFMKVEIIASRKFLKRISAM